MLPKDALTFQFSLRIPEMEKKPEEDVDYAILMGQELQDPSAPPQLVQPDNAELYAPKAGGLAALFPRA